MVGLVLLLAPLVAVGVLFTAADGFKGLVFVAVCTPSDLRVTVIESKEKLLLLGELCIGILWGKLQDFTILVHLCRVFVVFLFLGANFNDDVVHPLVEAIFGLILVRTDCLAWVSIDANTRKFGQFIVDSCRRWLWRVSCCLDSGHIKGNFLLQNQPEEILFDSIFELRLPQVHIFVFQYRIYVASLLVQVMDQSHFHFLERCFGVIIDFDGLAYFSERIFRNLIDWREN